MISVLTNGHFGLCKERRDTLERLQFQPWFYVYGFYIYVYWKHFPVQVLSGILYSTGDRKLFPEKMGAHILEARKHEKVIPKDSWTDSSDFLLVPHCSSSSQNFETPIGREQTLASMKRPSPEGLASNCTEPLCRQQYCFFLIFSIT